ncbi:helix-turn-helix transcriptional regulator [Acidovorax sp. SDU_ACID1]|uniref:helix-turn-helix transcriptional regulator n=1 Tax=Acidovorax sp. SDU_ACID1 TaxID=3136632 RepID=UPI0038730C91
MSIESITDQLYDGVLMPQDWGQALRAVSQAVDAHAFHQITVCRDDMRVGTVAAWLSDEALLPAKQREYETHFAALDVRMPGMLDLREGGLLLDHERFDGGTFLRAPIYAEFLASVDLRHTAAVGMRSGEDAHEVMGIMRHADQRPYGEREHALLRHWAPHLVRANRMRHASRRLAAEAALGMAALDALAHCVAVLGPQCHVRYLNAAAEAALALPLGLAVAHGRLRCAAPAAQEQLARLVAAACGAGGLPRMAGTLRLQADGGGPVLQVLPLQATHPLAAAWRAVPLALVTWRGGDASVARLQVALGLTLTEARLALYLVEGGTVKGFGAQRGTSWHTVRTHLRNLLRKTGCSGQAELVQRVLALG